MKKILYSALVLSLALGVASCKPKKSAYRQAYEQAKQREIAAQPSNTSPAKVTYEEPATPVQPATPVDARKERVSAVEGGELKRYNVVIGSFQNHSNARGLKEDMVAKGYRAVLAKNEYGMLRVIAASFDSKEEAAASREVIKSKFAPRFADAWILDNN